MEPLFPEHVSSPELIPQHFVAAWNARDAVALASLFAEDAEFVNVVGLWWHNRKSIWKAHDYGLRVIFPDSSLELRQSKLKMLTADIALVHARMKLSGQTSLEKGETPAPRTNIFTFVAQRFSAGWLCVAAHNNDQISGAETHVKGANGELKTADYRQ